MADVLDRVADHEVEVIRSPALAGVPHGFLGRRGGVSMGGEEVAGLQFGSGAGDDPAAVAENRARAVAAIAPGARLALPWQVHSPDVIVADGPLEGDDRPRGDAVVTAMPGLLAGVVTADCAPVLLADRRAGVVGAAHAGWRGAQAGVIAATVAAMEGLGARADRIAAAIGPCIAQASYEVGPDMRAAFADTDARFFAPGAGDRLRFDLAGYVAARLAAAGVGRIDPLGLDTYAAPARFYSYRRAGHRGAPGYGRQASLIACPAG